MVEKLKKRRGNSKYILSFPIFIVLFTVNIGLYLLVSPKAVYLFFILGIIEFILAKKRFNWVVKSSNMNILSALFLLLPSMMALIFNNKSEGFPIGVAGLIVLLGLRIYLMVTKTKKRVVMRSSSSGLFNLIILTLFVSNFYFMIFYNYQNKVKWVSKVPSGITSNLKFSDQNISFLTNDDFLRKDVYNFPQTYTIDKENGKTKDVEKGYKFSEEFSPFKGKVEKIRYQNLEISITGDKLYIEDISSKKQLFKFIVNGDIVTTPTIKDNILYLAANGRAVMDKIKRTDVYAVDIEFLLGEK
ncbi:hypothetical protein [Psychrilyobacter atlanticus]|uniref:hypothetical protein n=1 Tax=Psychrilyobacter atlanticus TaxID=271091 RepID=UPI0003F61768|nr:hypothetical protein [Psychrilyobacter atlanticus]